MDSTCTEEKKLSGKWTRPRMQNTAELETFIIMPDPVDSVPTLRALVLSATVDPMSDEPAASSWRTAVCLHTARLRTGSACHAGAEWVA